MTDTFPSWLEDDGEPASRRSRREQSGDDGRPRSRRRRKPRRSRTVLTLVILAVLIVLLGLLAVFAWQARTAYAELREALPKVTELREQALSGQSGAAAETTDALQEHTGTAREAVSGVHWDVAAKLPWLGPNITAARTATEVVDDLATGVLPDLVSATNIVNPARLAPQDGRINLAPFTEAAPRVIAANDAVQAAQERLDGIDTDGVVDLLRDELGDLGTQLDDVAGLTATASRAVQLIPPMLGAEEPRQYILMVQNNAEPRATGGLTGAFLLLEADDGALELLEQRSAGEVGRFPEPAVELTDTEIALFGTQLGRYPGNVTTTPDFPRSAEIITEMWRQGVGDQVDGVFSVDPVVLSYLLEASGPIEVPEQALAAMGVSADLLGGTAALTAENVVPTMLNAVYREIEDPDIQNEFFEVAAGAVFAEVMAGETAPAATVAALVEAADENRLLVWSARENEQALLAGTVLSGELRGDDDNGAPVVGVYVNDVSAAKIAYYERMDVTVEPQQCHADGTQELTVTVTLSSEAPEDAADLPVSLAGTGETVPKGDVRSNLLVYAPTGGRITEVRDPDREARTLPQIHNGQVVVARQIQMSPGESVTTELKISTGPGFTEDVLVRTTPGPGSERYTTSALTCRH